MLQLFIIALVVLHSHAVNWQGNWAFSCDFRGGDLSSAQVAGNKCGPTCQSTNGCTHFTWTTYKAGTCWMKSGPVTKNDAYDINDGSVICGILDNVPAPTPGINWQGNWANNCDFPGSDLTSAQVTASQCGPKCDSTNGCTHFTWTDFNGGTCWMKSGPVSKNDARPTGNGLCGIGSNTGSGPVVNPPSGGNSVALGVNYDAMHNPEYPLNGGSPAGLPSAMDRDFQQISRYFKYARTFYSNFYGYPVAQYAAKYGVKLYLGVYMTDESWYKSQVDSAVEAVKNFPNSIECILVGNENLRPNGPYSADQIIGRINGIKQAVRSATGRDIPVGTVQRITEWVNDGIRGETAKLAAAADILGVNIYPFFGSYDPNRPTDSLNAQWNLMVSRYGGSKVRLTETGHPTGGGNSPSGVVSSLDASVRYYNAVKNWKPSQANGPVFWFAMYDRQPADNSLGNGVEKNFGIFRFDRSQKSSQFP